MIHIGDIVRPIEGYICSHLDFVIKEVSRSWEDGKYLYKLKALINTIDSMYGPYEKQMKKVEQAEKIYWKERELNLVKTGKEFSQVFGNSYQSYEPSPDKPQEIISGFKCSTSGDTIDSLAYAIEEYNKNNKEDNKIMKILELYKERKEEAVLAEDEMQKIINEMTDQVNALLESENRTDLFYVESEGFTLTKTNEKLDKLNEEKEDEILQLNKTIEEIEAMFEMTEDYEERMKILKKYGIINKDGKLSI